jgi:hypothetical protein
VGIAAVCDVSYSPEFRAIIDVRLITFIAASAAANS